MSSSVLFCFSFSFTFGATHWCPQSWSTRHRSLKKNVCLIVPLSWFAEANFPLSFSLWWPHVSLHRLIAANSPSSCFFFLFIVSFRTFVSQRQRRPTAASLFACCKKKKKSERRFAELMCGHALAVYRISWCAQRQISHGFRYKLALCCRRLRGGRSVFPRSHQLQSRDQESLLQKWRKH